MRGTRLIIHRERCVAVILAAAACLLTCRPVAAGELQLGTWQHPVSIPIPVAEATAATDPNTGLIYLAGGYFSSGGLRSGTQFQIYNPTANSWAAGPDMPVNTRGGAAVYQGGKILVFGNTDPDSSRLQIFDIASNTWTSQTFTGGRWEQSATTGLNGKVYVFGGEAAGSNPPGTTTTLEYDPVNSTSAAKAVMPITRKQHESGLIGSTILVVGGNASSDLPTGQVDRYDPQTDSWSAAPADLTTPRLQFAGGVLANHFIVAGGSTENAVAAGPFFTSVEVYDPQTNLWSPGPGLPAGLREATGAASGNSFYVFGGFESGPALSQAVYRIDIVPEPAACCWILVLASTCRRPRRRTEGGSVTNAIKPAVTPRRYCIY